MFSCKRMLTVNLELGVTVDIPCKTEFQYRSNVVQDLVFLCVTKTPWPGHDESQDVAGIWMPTA